MATTTHNVVRRAVSLSLLTRRWLHSTAMSAFKARCHSRFLTVWPIYFATFFRTGWAELKMLGVLELFSTVAHTCFSSPSCKVILDSVPMSRRLYTVRSQNLGDAVCVVRSEERRPGEAGSDQINLARYYEQIENVTKRQNATKNNRGITLLFCLRIRYFLRSLE